MDGRPNREKKLKRIRVDRALVVPYRNIMLIPPFWRENNFFVSVSFVYFSFSLELPHTTTTKITLASKYSRLSLNGHLYKTDISVKRTPILELAPAFLSSLHLTLYETDISLRRRASAGPRGVRLRES